MINSDSFSIIFTSACHMCVQDSDAKQRHARAVVESRRLVDQHVFSVQKEAAKADAHLQKQQEDIRDCMVLTSILFDFQFNYSVALPVLILVFSGQGKRRHANFCENATCANSNTQAFTP